MAVTPDAPAPYAPAKAVLVVINRYRGGLPAPLTAQVLARAGITDSLIPRTLQALQTLDLIEENGAATQTLESLRRAPEPEFQQRLGEWLNSAYADVRRYVDPATATESQILDAFRSYNPVGQRPRMVTLFSGLYAAAGIRAVERQARTSRATRILARVGQQQPRQRSDVHPRIERDAPASITLVALPRALEGLLATLPPNGGGWTKARRDSFMATFGAVLDYCIPIEQEPDVADAA